MPENCFEDENVIWTSHLFLLFKFLGLIRRLGSDILSVQLDEGEPFKLKLFRNYERNLVA